jgi:ABC-2 type transport system permease protein
MSLFPFTAPIALPMRAVFTPIPALQILISLGLLWVLAILSLWLAGRVFRLGMLRYGKRMSFREIFQHA